MTLKDRVLLAALISAALPAIAHPGPDAQEPLTVEKIYLHGPITGDTPEGITWSPDGKHLTYLVDGELREIDLETGKPHTLLSAAKLGPITGGQGTEQDRDHRERYKMPSYVWSSDSQHLLFDSNGRLWLFDLHTGTGVQVGFTDAASGDDPKFSPDGKSISFVRAHGLVVVQPREIGDLGPINVAQAPNPNTMNGEVDWVYEEELDVRSNYFWSPDSKSIAYLQMNESNVPQYPITDWLPVHSGVDMQRYPQPGDPNPDVRVGVVGAGGGHTTWMKVPIKAGQDYIPRFGWLDRHTLWIETLSRDHQHRSIYFAEAGTGQSRQVLEISDDKFLDENYNVEADNGAIALTNWKDGHNHVYLYRFDGSNPAGVEKLEEKQLTHGDFEVKEISELDAAHHTIYYVSNEGNLVEQQLWQVDFDGQRKKLSEGNGVHEGNFSPNGGAFTDKFSTRMTPPVERYCKIGGACTTFWSSKSLAKYHLRAPEQLEVKAHDGTVLYATLLLPEGTPSAGTVPLIVNPYGGPGPQTVENKWDERTMLFDQVLAEHGFAVLHADNRGSGMRGRDFAQAAYHNFGPVQLEDQLTVVDAALIQYPQLDKDQMGWWGWSWGGTFTLYALTHSDRFKAGVAVAPVTDWRDYDSVYTERYMSQPGEFPEGYKNFSVVNSAAHLHGNLLIAHGTGDDNVHLENTVQFIQRLIEAEKPYDLQIYPRKTHSIAGPDVRVHLFNRILEHFQTYLNPADEY